MTDLSPGFSGIGSQSMLGSCGAFAAVSIIEYFRNRMAGTPGPSLSPLYAYFHARPADDYATTQDIYKNKPDDFPDPAKMTDFCDRARTGGPDSHSPFVKDLDRGCSVHSIKSALEHFGVCEEADHPYDPSKKGDQPEFQAVDYEYTGHEIGKFAEYPPHKLEKPAKKIFGKYVDRIEIQYNNPAVWIREIQDENPVVVGINSTDEFQAAMGTHFFGHVGGKKTGGHFIVLAGYDPDYRPFPLRQPALRCEAFLVRNSWGPDWGEEGYIWISKEALLAMVDVHVDDTLILRPRKKKKWKPLPGPSPAALPSVSTPVTPPGPMPPRPVPTPPTPTPTPPTPTPTPPPGTPPTPTPTPPPGTPPTPTPTPPPGGAADFIYVWWLFDNRAQFHRVQSMGMSPNSLGGMGQRLYGPKRTHPNIKFKDINAMISRPENAGKIVGLGAVRISEVKSGAPESADRMWKWVSKRLGDEPPKLIIEKKVSGTLHAPVTIDFTVEKPDGSVETVTVTVPAGNNPRGSEIRETIPGKHKIDEPDIPGMIHTSPEHMEFDIPAGITRTATFKNKIKKGTTPPPPPPPPPRKVIVIPKKNARLPHPPHHGSTSNPVFNQGEVTRLPDTSRGATASETTREEIDFMLMKGEGEMRLGWVCYIIRESDGEVMNPDYFNLRIVASATKRVYQYDGNEEHFGYVYNYFTTPKSPSKVEFADDGKTFTTGTLITFDPYLDIPDSAELGDPARELPVSPTPGKYRIVLEIAEWPEGWGRKTLKNPALGSLRVLDQNFVRFEVKPSSSSAAAPARPGATPTPPPAPTPTPTPSATPPPAPSPPPRPAATPPPIPGTGPAPTAAAGTGPLASLTDAQIIADLDAAQDEFADSEYTNDITVTEKNLKKVFGFMEGDIKHSRVLISAPHGVRHIRDVNAKDADTRSGSIAKVVHKYTKAPLIYLKKKSADPNFYDKVPEFARYGRTNKVGRELPYKEKILEVLKKHKNIILVMDIHGSGPTTRSGSGLRVWDIDLGTMGGVTKDPEKVKQNVIETFEKHGFSVNTHDVDAQDHWPGGPGQNTVTKYVYNTTLTRGTGKPRVDSIQVEIRETFRKKDMPASDRAKIVRALVEIIQKVNSGS